MSTPKHIALGEGYRNTMAYYQPQHAVAIVRDWHPLRRAIATGAMSVMLVSALAVPNVAFAADSIWFEGDEAETTDAIDTDTFQWGGAGTDDMTMSNYDGAGFSITGDANLSVEGDNTVNGSIYASGDLSITGDDTVYGEDKPSITLTNEDKSTNGYNSIAAGGNLSISDMNITFDNEGYAGDYYSGGIRANGTYDGYDDDAQKPIYKDGNLTITNSKIAAKDAKAYTGENDPWNNVYINANGTMGIKGSVIDVNSVFSVGQMTIDNSDVTATRNYVLEDDAPFTGVSSMTGIELIGEENGEVKEYTAPWGTKYYYVTTGSDDKVELKATERPAYYGPTQGMPATGDTENAGLMAGAAAAAAASLAAVGMSLGFRKRGQHEA